MSHRAKRSKRNKNGNTQSTGSAATTPSTTTPQSNTPSSTRDRRACNRPARSVSHPSTPSRPSSATTHSIPRSRRHRNRHASLAANTRSALLDSTYSRADRQHEHLEAHSPFNPYQSFFSLASCDEILSALVLALKSLPATDVHVHPSGYRIRGRHFLDGACAEFQIEMLQTPSTHPTHPGHVLVELQHRNGDGFVFQRLLHSLFTELHKTELIAASQYLLSAECHLSPNPAFNFKLFQEHSQNSNPNGDEEKVSVVQMHGNAQNGNGQIQSQSTQSAQSALNVHLQEMDDATLRMLLCALFDSRGEREVCRMASAWFARHLRSANGNNDANAVNAHLVRRILRAEPMFMGKVSELLLKCVDAQTMQSVGCVVYWMLRGSAGFKENAVRLNLKGVCEKALRRWTEPIEKRYKGNSKYVIRVISSEEVAQRMAQCIEVLN